MVDWTEYKSELERIKHQWDLAESDIKLAEQVCNNVVVPAIKELRYAGRRLADALSAIAGNSSLGNVQQLLTDAEYDCHRARHDAIDAATSKIAIDLDIMQEKLGYAVILKAYPKFSALFIALNGVRDKIAVSREDRKNREAIYATIEVVDFPNLVRMFRDLQTAEKLMVKLARAERRKSTASILIGVLFLIIGLAFTAYTWIVPWNPAVLQAPAPAHAPLGSSPKA